MILKSLHIISFGGLRGCDIDLSAGVNTVFGANEAGKTSAAMFIKFIFYGLSSKASKTSGASERQRFINRTTGQAAGYIMAQTDSGTLYRLERAIITSDNAAPRERVRIINQSTGEIITGVNPGEHFFGVPAEVFTSTCFLSQASAARPDLGPIGQSSSGRAVDNLLTSADESIDLTRALEKLDAARRQLLHKNKSGGEIRDLKEKRGALMAELKSGSERAQEILTLSVSLDEIKKRIAQLEEAEQNYSGIFSALEKISHKRRLDSAQQTRARIAGLTETLAALEASPLGSDPEESLNESERDIRAYDEECAVYDEKIAVFDAAPAEELPDAADVIEEVQRADTSSRLLGSVAVALLAAGVIALGASFLLHWFNTELYIFPLVMTLILLFLGVTFMFRRIKTQKHLTALLEQWDAESAEEIETAVQEKMSVLDRSRAMALERDRMNASLEAAKLRFDTAQQHILDLANAVHLPDSGDIYQTLDSLREMAAENAAERKETAEKITRLTGRLETLEEQLAGINPAQAELEAYTALESPHGKIAAELDQDGIRTAVQEKDFTENALRAARKRQSALEERLRELGKLTHTPDEIATMLSALDEHIEELSLRHDACELAQEALRKAGEAMRSDTVPRLAADASAILAAASPHDRILFDAGWNASLSSGGDILPAEHLSRGTSDLAYIALRIALAREMFKNESPVLILDESFAHIDEERIRSLFRSLSGGQYLLFTCRRSEADIAASLGCTVLSL